MIFIDHLPDEILTKILAFLHPDDWYWSLQRVSKKFRKSILLLVQTLNTISYDSSTSHLLFSGVQADLKYGLNIDHSPTDFKISVIKWMIRNAGHHLKSVALLEITNIENNRVKFLKILIKHLTTNCPKILNLKLTGNVVSIVWSLNFWKRTLHNLESLILEENSYTEFGCLETEDQHSSNLEQNYARTTAEFGEYLVQNCRKLKKIHLLFPYVRGPSQACFGCLAKLKLESLTWLLYKPYDADYIEGLLDAIVESGSELDHLNIYSEVKSLDCQKMENFGQQISHMSKLRRLFIGFQLMRRSVINDYISDDMDIEKEYFDTVDEAPWTENFLRCFKNGFESLEILGLRNFDLKSCQIPDFLKNCLKKIGRLSFESCYNFDDDFLERCFDDLLPNLVKLEIYTAKLNYRNLAEVVLKFCPNLECLALSNVDGLSYKQLILSLHLALHNCGNKNSRKPLIVDMGTSTSFYLEEVDQLKQTQICGLSVEKSSRKNMRIERSCDL